jgi:hypothetical protein
MKRLIFKLLLILGILTPFACDQTSPEGDDPANHKSSTGTLDMAFVYRVQGIPSSRMKKVQLSLATTADNLYLGIFFIQANVSDAMTHYRFELPPGDYYYYAKILCLCGGDSCYYSGFSREDATMAAGGKVSVEAGKICSYTTNFH